MEVEAGEELRESADAFEDDADDEGDGDDVAVVVLVVVENVREIAAAAVVVVVVVVLVVFAVGNDSGTVALATARAAVLNLNGMIGIGGISEISLSCSLPPHFLSLSISLSAAAALLYRLGLCLILNILLFIDLLTPCCIAADASRSSVSSSSSACVAISASNLYNQLCRRRRRMLISLWQKVGYRLTPPSRIRRRWNREDMVIVERATDEA